MTGTKIVLYRDFLEGSLVYAHDDSEEKEDVFMMTVSDGVFTSDQYTLKVNVLPVDDEFPVLLTNEGGEVNEGEGLLITHDLLRATDIVKLLS